MTKEELKEVLKEVLKDSLGIDITEKSEYGYKTFEISITFDGEEISSSSVCVSGDANWI